MIRRYVIFCLLMALCFVKVAALSDNLSLDGDFTDREKQVIQTASVGLFDGKEKITIDLTSVPDSAWTYMLREGRVISPYAGARKRHSGIDVKTHKLDTIYAVFDGRVRFAKAYYGYGNVIVVRHANGLETVYAHNSKHLVKVGDMVKAGQPIAIVGRTGRATTEHCHFEVRINGKHFNPARIFDTSRRELKSVKIVAHKSGKLEFF